MKWQSSQLISLKYSLFITECCWCFECHLRLQSCLLSLMASFFGLQVIDYGWGALLCWNTLNEGLRIWGTFLSYGWHWQNVWWIYFQDGATNWKLCIGLWLSYTWWQFECFHSSFFFLFCSLYAQDLVVFLLLVSD